MNESNTAKNTDVPDSEALLYFQSFLTTVPKTCYKCARSSQGLVPALSGRIQAPAHFGRHPSFESRLTVQAVRNLHSARLLLLFLNHSHLMKRPSLFLLTTGCLERMDFLMNLTVPLDLRVRPNLLPTVRLPVGFLLLMLLLVLSYPSRLHTDHRFHSRLMTLREHLRILLAKKSPVLLPSTAIERQTLHHQCFLPHRYSAEELPVVLESLLSPC